jgi:type IV pilus assembly protein PilA
MVNRSSGGFTLIEIMVAVAIIALLAVIALPTYQEYLIRSQVSEGLALVSPLETAVNESWSATGNFPTSLNDVGITTTPQGKYVSSVSIAPGGVINIVFSASPPQSANAALDTLVLSLVPYTDGQNDLYWLCGLASAPGAPFVIASGAVNSTSFAAVANTAKYLPQSCRS